MNNGVLNAGQLRLRGTTLYDLRTIIGHWFDERNVAHIEKYEGENDPSFQTHLVENGILVSIRNDKNVVEAFTAFELVRDMIEKTGTESQVIAVLESEQGSTINSLWLPLPGQSERLKNSVNRVAQELKDVKVEILNSPTVSTTLSSLKKTVDWLNPSRDSDFNAENQVRIYPKPSIHHWLPDLISAK